MALVKPHPHILKAPVYIAGEASVPGVEKPAKLSSNESPLGPSPNAIEAYRQVVNDLARYPDSSATKLRLAIARHYGVNAEKLICSNGSEQLIDILTRAYAGLGDEVVFTEYAFIAYRIAAQISGATPVAVAERDFTTDVDALLAAVTDKTRIVFLANPNNPTGTYIAKREVQRLRAGLSENVLLVIDAAYSEYVECDDYSDSHEWVNDEPGNTVVLHTFSKIYGLAALRVGWAYCPREIVQVLTRVRGVFNVASPAQAAAVAALADTAHIEKAKAHNRQWLAWLQDELHKQNLKVSPSIGNFVLIHFKDTEQCKAVDEYLRKQGIILRPVGGYGLPQCLRATIGLEAENRRLNDLLKTFLNQA